MKADLHLRLQEEQQKQLNMLKSSTLESSTKDTVKRRKQKFMNGLKEKYFLQQAIEQ